MRTALQAGHTLAWSAGSVPLDLPLLRLAGNVSDLPTGDVRWCARILRSMSAKAEAAQRRGNAIEALSGGCIALGR